jgi:hypothetical protein
MYFSNITLLCKDLFKVKENFQSNPKNRVDIYIPVSSANQLADKITEICGSEEVASNNYTDPNNYNKGFRDIPKIQKASKDLYKTAKFEIYREKVLGNSYYVFINHESPKGSFNTMNSNEIHIAIGL